MPSPISRSSRRALNSERRMTRSRRSGLASVPERYSANKANRRPGTSLCDCRGLAQGDCELDQQSDTPLEKRGVVGDGAQESGHGSSIGIVVAEEVVGSWLPCPDARWCRGRHRVRPGPRSRGVALRGHPAPRQCGAVRRGTATIGQFPGPGRGHGGSRGAWRRT